MIELSAKLGTDGGATTYLFRQGVTGERITSDNLATLADAELAELRKRLLSTLRITEDLMEDRQLLGRVTRRIE